MAFVLTVNVATTSPALLAAAPRTLNVVRWLTMAPSASLIALAAFAVLVGSSNAFAELRHQPVLLPPVSPACISSPFGPRVLPNRPQAGSYHYGVDLPAPEGASVFATAPGTVIRIQNKGPGGLEMLVQHDGFVGIYSHFGMIMPAIVEGKGTIGAGEKLGVVGITGITTGAHVYFEMIIAGKPADPSPYLEVPHCNSEVHRTVNNWLDADPKGLAQQSAEWRPYQWQHYQWQHH
jgi:murein DD-endopeptidase MepM/ murein hydrolase activator NlpD